MFRFAHPEWLYALLMIPVMVLLFMLNRALRNKTLQKLGDKNLLQEMMPGYTPVRPLVRFVLLMLAVGFLIVALARPQVGSKLTQVKRKGIELFIALDVSNSMLAQDVQPSRLERAKQAVARLADKLSNDRIGLLVFAGSPYIQVPVTTDYVSIKQFLDGIHPGMVPVQGTAIGAAIRLAASSFDPQSGLKKAIAIITDGENHEDDAVEAAREAAEKGIVVFVIGVGTPSGAPIPLPGGDQQNFLKDQSGQVVVTRLDEALLNQIAAAGNGTYIRATALRFGLEEILTKIDEMDRKEYKAQIYSEYDDQFMYPAGLALFFLLFELFLQDRRNPWLRKFNLFRLKL